MTPDRSDLLAVGAVLAVTAATVYYIMAPASSPLAAWLRRNSTAVLALGIVLGLAAVSATHPGELNYEAWGNLP